MARFQEPSNTLQATPVRITFPVPVSGAHCLAETCSELVLILHAAAIDTYVCCLHVLQNIFPQDQSQEVLTALQCVYWNFISDTSDLPEKYVLIHTTLLVFKLQDMQNVSLMSVQLSSMLTVCPPMSSLVAGPLKVCVCQAAGGMGVLM